MVNFVDYDGSRVRPFNSYTECDELIIENWNKLVKPNDKIYFLGDLTFNKNYCDKIMPRLNGKKCLIKGNHDNYKLKWYSLWFYDVRGCHNLESYLLTHIPVHPDSKNRFKRNIHGHLHTQFVKRKKPVAVYEGYNAVLRFKEELDPWYRNVCVDANNYTPVPFEVIQKETEELINIGEIVIPKKIK